MKMNASDPKRAFDNVVTEIDNVRHHSTSAIALTVRNHIMPRFPNQKFATRENLFALLEGDAYKEPAIIALALSDSKIICTGEAPKAAYRFIREFVEDVIFPDIAKQTGTEIDPFILDEESEEVVNKKFGELAEQWFNAYDQRGLPDETLANFVELLKTYCE